MAAEPNNGFHQGQSFASSMNQHGISFQSTSMDSTDQMFLMGNYSGWNNTNDMMLAGNSGYINNSYPGLNSSGTSSGSLLLDSVPGMKIDTSLAVEWSVDEQYKLEEGLVKYAAEPSIQRYIKIAALLRDKTVRDVALRCRWMTRKRRKQDDRTPGYKGKDRKDKYVESSSKMNMYSASPSNRAPYPQNSQLKQTSHLNLDAFSGVTRHLLEQNNQVLSQISANLSIHKLQDNVDLFCCMRNNINTVLNEMRDMPGVMSQMPPLPLTINEDLANSILPSSSQTMMYGSQMKQEPRC